jgi:hypothetical protein
MPIIIDITRIPVMAEVSNVADWSKRSAHSASEGRQMESWAKRLIDHLTQPRDATSPPSPPTPPGMPPEAYDRMKINDLTVRQVANILANENRDVLPGKSAPGQLPQAKVAQAHAIINADRAYGAQRAQKAQTADKEVNPALENSRQYQEALTVARTAFQEQLSDKDPVGGRMYFNNRPTASTNARQLGKEKVSVFGKPFGPFQRGGETVYTDIYENPKN